MACSILEITYSKFISDADGNLIRAVLLCDTAAELPGINYFTGYTLIQGSTCHVIADNQDYMLDSGGSWHPYGGEMLKNVYTKTEIDALLEDKQDELTFDTVPTSGSTNPVESNGIYTETRKIYTTNQSYNFTNTTANVYEYTGIYFNVIGGAVYGVWVVERNNSAMPEALLISSEENPSNISTSNTFALAENTGNIAYLSLTSCIYSGSTRNLYLHIKRGGTGANRGVISVNRLTGI